LRTNFRKELKQLRDAEKSGASDEDIEPTLWYFEEIKFLHSQETPTVSISTMDECKDSITPSIHEKDHDTSYYNDEVAVSISIFTRDVQKVRLQGPCRTKGILFFKVVTTVMYRIF